MIKLRDAVLIIVGVTAALTGLLLVNYVFTWPFNDLTGVPWQDVPRMLGAIWALALLIVAALAYEAVEEQKSEHLEHLQRKFRSENGNAYLDLLMVGFMAMMLVLAWLFARGELARLLSTNPF